MTRCILLAGAGMALLLTSRPAYPIQAQPRQILSPRDSASLQMDTNRISIDYGRPSTRGRIIMGGLVPWNEVWRTGANQATHLRTSFDMTMGGVPVPRGTYTLWTIPSPTVWKVILNRQTGQWGTQYSPGMDLARFDVRAEQLPAPVDTFTVAFRQTGKTSGVMTLSWERMQAGIPFEKSDRIRPLSPLDSTEVTVKGTSIKVTYSRPAIRGRSIWGVVVPLDSVWRTGANAATSLTLTGDVSIGGVAVPRGSYSLYSVPSAKSFTLLVNRRPGGTMPRYEREQDLARVVMSPENPATMIDPFTVWLLPDGENAALLRLGWADKSWSTRIVIR